MISNFLKIREQFKEADKLLFTWFTNMRSLKKNINGRLLLELFKKILRHSDKNVPSDEACEGWIQRWIERRDIRLKGVHGEKQDCPDFSNYLAEMAPIIVQNESTDIFNAYETALFYHIQTTQTFAMPGEKVYEQKIEILVAASAKERSSHYCALVESNSLVGR